MSADSVLVVYLSIFLAGIVCEETNQIVTTKYGLVEGYLSNNGLYYEFCGIKYGEPIPFRAPKEPRSHAGVFKANKKDIFCPQFPSNDLFGAPSDNLDCLVLNVFTPTSFQTNVTLPVMIYLHGGDFGVGSGSPSFYGPQYLISHDVIIVTLNYRLNVYGFLNLGIKEAPGNAGLKDIRAALRWVKDNIANFGGDAGNITVFGQGSGGVAALYLMLSNSTKGLFHKVISQSGTPFGPQSFDSNPKLTASHLANTLGYKTEDPEELFEVYSKTDTLAVEEAISKQINSKFVFVPSAELAFEDEEAFLVDNPFNIINGRRDCFNPVPLLIGLTTVEGLISALDYNTITSQVDRIMHEDLKCIDQRNFRIPEKEMNEYRHSIADAYFSNMTDEESVIGGLINFNSDFCYVGPLSLFSELFANSNVEFYEYVFDYIGTRNLGRQLTNTSLEATTHLDELLYLFEFQRFPLPMDENDARIVTFMTTMWTNFAKHGNPTPDPTNGAWLPYPQQLAILLEPQYVAPLTPERAYFWKTFYFQYGAEICQNDINDSDK